MGFHNISHIQLYFLNSQIIIVWFKPCVCPLPISAVEYTIYHSSLTQRHTQKELIKLRCVCLFPFRTSFLRKLTLAMTGYDFLYLAFPCFRVRHNKKRIIKKRTSVRFFIICCRLFRDTYHGAKACPMLPVPTWSPFCRSCNRGLWKFRRGAEICPILRYKRDPSNR